MFCLPTGLFGGNDIFLLSVFSFRLSGRIWFYLSPVSTGSSHV